MSELTEEQLVRRINAFVGDEVIEVLVWGDKIQVRVSGIRRVSPTLVGALSKVYRELMPVEVPSTRQRNGS